MRTGLWLLLSLAPLSLIGCLDDPDDEAERRCDRAINGSALEGRWTLRATGRRFECSDRRLEGKLTVETSTPVRVVTEAQATSGAPQADDRSGFEADAFVDRIERADFLVEAEDPQGDGVEVGGSVTGSCFLVHLEEALPGGDRVRYDLDGFITTRGEARGELTGLGPEDCRTEGTFRLQID